MINEATSAASGVVPHHVFIRKLCLSYVPQREVAIGYFECVFLARCIRQGGIIHDLDRRNPWNTQLSHMTVPTLTPQVVGAESKDFSELCKYCCSEVF